MAKLTKAQKLWLGSLDIGGRYHIANRLPIKALVAMGFAEVNRHGCTSITPAGRAALQSQDPTPPHIEGEP